MRAVATKPDRPGPLSPRIHLTHPEPLALDAAATARLHARARRSAARRRGDPQLVSATCAVQCGPLTELLRGARVPGDPWMLVEQPDRGGRGLLALGAALRLPVGDLPGRRFDDLAGRWRALAARALADPPDGLPGAGPVLLGGAAFAPGGGRGGAWAGFGGGDFTVPEVAIARHGGRAALTVTLCVRPGDDAHERVQEALLATSTLVPEPPLPADPFLAAPSVRSVLDPGHFTGAVSAAVKRIRAGELAKVVLAREVEVHGPEPWDAATVLERLATRFPACFVFGAGRGHAAMVGASPELLLRCEGRRAETVALAGTSRRSADPSVDAHLGQALLASAKDRHEHRLVVERITRALAPGALWVTAAPEPQIATVANAHHLATPIRAQLGGGAGLIELVGSLHPTPAVGGEPRQAALAAIPRLEGFDRGWYAGPLGWVDQRGDGEFFVGLRSGVLRGDQARLFAGVGVVGDSDPAAELAETELKLEAMLGALRGAS